MTENDVRLLAEVDQRAKGNARQIVEIKGEIKEIRAENKAIYSLVESVKTISENLADMKSDIKEIKDNQNDLSKKVTDIENRPAKETAERWEKIKTAVYSSVATFLVMGIIGAIIYFR